MQSDLNQPDIFDFTDYKVYLKELYFYKKETAKLSLRVFARTAGFSAHGTLAKILDGERKLTLDSAVKVAKGFGLNAKETTYLSLLVRFKHSETLVEKEDIYLEMLRMRPARNISPIEKVHYELFSKWYIFAIRELVSSEDFQEDYGWIAGTLQPEITSEQAREAIDVLLKAGYLERKDDKLIQSSPDLTTGAEVDSFFVAKYHASQIGMAVRSLDTTPAAWRDISSVSFLATETEFRELKGRIQEFRVEILDFIRKNREQSLTEGKPTVEVLYNLNMQLYNTSKITFTEAQE